MNAGGHDDSSPSSNLTEAKSDLSSSLKSIQNIYIDGFLKRREILLHIEDIGQHVDQLHEQISGLKSELLSLETQDGNDEDKASLIDEIKKLQELQDLKKKEKMSYVRQLNNLRTEYTLEKFKMMKEFDQFLEKIDELITKDETDDLLHQQPQPEEEGDPTSAKNDNDSEKNRFCLPKYDSSGLMNVENSGKYMISGTEDLEELEEKSEHRKSLASLDEVSLCASQYLSIFDIYLTSMSYKFIYADRVLSELLLSTS